MRWRQGGSGDVRLRGAAAAAELWDGSGAVTGGEDRAGVARGHGAGVARRGVGIWCGVL